MYVDVATAQLISWVAMRGMTAVAAAGNTSIMGFRSLASPATRSCVPTCRARVGGQRDDDVLDELPGAYKLGTGLELPGMSSALKGLIEKIAELNPHILDVDKVQKATRRRRRPT